MIFGVIILIASGCICEVKINNVAVLLLFKYESNQYTSTASTKTIFNAIKVHFWMNATLTIPVINFKTVFRGCNFTSIYRSVG